MTLLDSLGTEVDDLAETAGSLLRLWNLPNESRMVLQDMEEQKRMLMEAGGKLAEETSRSFESESGLRKTFIHGRMGERISGADLVMEVKDKKTLFIQSKRIGRTGRYHVPRHQMYHLLKLCCNLHGDYFPVAWGFIGLSCRRHCGVLYEFRESEEDKKYISACEVRFILGGRGSIHAREIEACGFDENGVSDLFRKCIVGMRDIPYDQKRELFRMYSVMTNRLLILFEISNLPGLQ